MKFNIGDQVVVRGKSGVVDAVHITRAQTAFLAPVVRYDVRQEGEMLQGVLEAEVALSEVETLRREVEKLQRELAAMRSKTFGGLGLGIHDQVARRLGEMPRQPQFLGDVSFGKNDILCAAAKANAGY